MCRLSELVVGRTASHKLVLFFLSVAVGDEGKLNMLIKTPSILSD